METHICDYDIHCHYCRRECYGDSGKDWVMVEISIYGRGGVPNWKYVICRPCYDREILGQMELPL